jgi:hypothetical protein
MKMECAELNSQGAVAQSARIRNDNKNKKVDKNKEITKN